jgi:hypothetical protein
MRCLAPSVRGQRCGTISGRTCRVAPGARASHSIVGDRSRQRSDRARGGRPSPGCHSWQRGTGLLVHASTLMCLVGRARGDGYESKIQPALCVLHDTQVPATGRARHRPARLEERPVHALACCASHHAIHSARPSTITWCSCNASRWCGGTRIACWKAQHVCAGGPSAELLSERDYRPECGWFVDQTVQAALAVGARCLSDL